MLAEESRTYPVCPYCLHSHRRETLDDVCAAEHEHCRRRRESRKPTPLSTAEPFDKWSQPAPTPSAGPALWDLVQADMVARDHFGKGKYGVRLAPHNSRDFLQDAYQEALDLAVYLRGAMYERDGK